MNTIRRFHPIRSARRAVISPFSVQMGPWSSQAGRFGAVDLGRRKAPKADEKETKALAARERRRGGRARAGAALMAAGQVSATVIVGYPWTLVAGSIAGLAGAALSLSSLFGRRGSKALAGDKSAVRGFARRAARWNSSKRARVAKKLLDQYKRFKGKLKKKEGRKGLFPKKRKQRVKEGKIGVAVRKKMAIRRLKLEVLYALEARARGNKKARLLKDDPESVAEDVEANPRADDDLPDDAEDTAEEFEQVRPDGAMSSSTMYLLIGGGILAVVGAVVLTRSSRPSYGALPPQGYASPDRQRVA